MAIIWVTLLIGLGVMFGMASLVTDVGYGMVQGRAMQNGADAGVIAGAKLMSESVAAAEGGGIVYAVSNGALHARVSDFAGDNRPAPLGGATYRVAVEYRPCPTQSPGAATWTADSDPGIVSEVGGTPQADTSLEVPAWTCAIRVFARVTHNGLFSTAIGVGGMGETARATARIFPSTPPTVVGDVWPLTRWLCTGDDDLDTKNKDEGKTLDDDLAGDDDPDQCDDDELDTNGDGVIDLPCRQNVGEGVRPCTFWDANSAPGGSFKNYLDFSRFSGLAKDVGIKRASMLEGWADACDELAPDYCAPAHQYDPAVTGSDPEAFPGNSDAGGGHNDKLVDVPYWIEHGFKGKVRVDPADCENVVNRTFSGGSPPSLVTDPNQCLNSRPERFNGDLGNNVSSAIEAYIDAHPGGNGPDECGYTDPNDSPDPPNNPDNDYATVTVALWRWAEQDTEYTEIIDPVTGEVTFDTNDSIALTNQSELWGYYQSNASDFGITSNAKDLVKRVVLARLARFRFCRGFVSEDGNSRVRGWFVSWDVSSPPVCPTEPCPPSPEANTVVLTD
jgi:hypothetical protein